MNTASIRAVPTLRACGSQLASAITATRPDTTPFRHWSVKDVFPKGLTQALAELPLAAQDVGAVSGAREFHNDTRTYVDAAAMAQFTACRTLAEVFQDTRTARFLEDATGADLDGTCLRIEMAQDASGFWLKPHTDLGVKRFTMLYYLAPDDRPELGTDIYSDSDTHARRVPFVPGSALVFVPGADTWHGFEPRKIGGVRRSAIINYVTPDWRAREQLAWPDRPVRTRS